MEIIVRKGFQAHYNSALDKVIHTRQEYDREMKSRGFVTFEKGQQLAESAKVTKTWTPSKDLTDKLRYIKNRCDSKGNIKHPNDLAPLYKESKIATKLPDWCPKHYTEGGYAV